MALWFLPLIAAGVSAIGGAIAAGKEAEAIRAKAKYESEQLKLNARLADMNAEDVLYASGRAIGQVERYRRTLRAQQKSVLATTNLDSSFGSAGAIQMETETMANLDMITVKNNAWREAWGFRFEAIQNRTAATMTFFGAENKANSTLLAAKINAVTGVLGAGAKAAGNIGGGGSPKKIVSSRQRYIPGKQSETFGFGRP